jgi:hypothetical protein
LVVRLTILKNAMEIRKEQLEELKKGIKLYTLSSVIVNTLDRAPEFLEDYLKKFRESNLPKNRKTFVAWLETMLPKNYELEVIDKNVIVFQVVNIQEKLTTKPEDLRNTH